MPGIQTGVARQMAPFERGRIPARVSGKGIIDRNSPPVNDHVEAGLVLAKRLDADGGFEESQLYYTTPQTNNQAGNAGNAREKVIFPADFLPGACRTGAEG